MNAISRTVSTRSIRGIESLPTLNLFPLAHQGVWVIALVVALLLSALGLVYAKDLSRRFFIELQQVKQHIIIATEQSNELLLEKGTLVAQPRIARIAEKSLGMVLPQRDETQILHHTL